MTKKLCIIRNNEKDTSIKVHSGRKFIFVYHLSRFTQFLKRPIIIINHIIDRLMFQRLRYRYTYTRAVAHYLSF
jgi:hypothetical protein